MKMTYCLATIILLFLAGCNGRPAVSSSTRPTSVQAINTTVVGADGLVYTLVRLAGVPNAYGVADAPLWKCESKPGLFIAGLSLPGQSPIFRRAQD